MPHAMRIRQTGGTKALNWTALDLGEPGYGQVRLRQTAAAAGLNAQISGRIDPMRPVVLSLKGSLFLTRPMLFHYIQRRDALEASARALPF
jgi:hypothetical protein